jgi:hypothetical protein
MKIFKRFTEVEQLRIGMLVECHDRGHIRFGQIGKILEISGSNITINWNGYGAIRDFTRTYYNINLYLSSFLFSDPVMSEESFNIFN